MYVRQQAGLRLRLSALFIAWMWLALRWLTRYSAWRHVEMDAVIQHFLRQVPCFIYSPGRPGSSLAGAVI